MSSPSETLDTVVQKTVQAIETIAPEAWQLLVKAQVVEGWVGLIEIALAVLLVCGLAVSCRLARPHVVDRIKDDTDRTVATYFYYGAIVLLSIIAMGWVSCMPEQIARIVAPDVHAARELLSKAGR